MVAVIFVFGTVTGYICISIYGMYKKVACDCIKCEIIYNGEVYSLNEEIKYTNKMVANVITEGSCIYRAIYTH